MGKNCGLLEVTLIAMIVEDSAGIKQALSYELCHIFCSGFVCSACEHHNPSAIEL